MARQPAPGTRERILDNAEELFYEHGIHAVGMQRVIDASQCGKSLLYREFPSKDDLVVAYLRRFQERWRALVTAALKPLADDPPARLVAFAGLVADQVSEPDYRGCAFRNCYVEFPEADQSPGIVAGDHLRGVRDELHQLAAQTDAQDPALLADRLLLVLEGMYASAAHPGGTDAANVGMSLVRELVAGATEWSPSTS